MKKIENVQMGNTWTTYIGSVHGALKAGGIWDVETWRLMGMTGMAFHFIMHEQSCPSSVTVYDWVEEHQGMLDRVGIYSEIMMRWYPGSNTFEAAKSAALGKIRESIDRGVPVVIWAPTPLLEFGLIRGYDDADKVFQVISCIEPDPDPLTYENLGRSEVPIMYIEIIHGRIEIDPAKTHRSALKFGIGQWEKERHADEKYASGRKAYEALVHTLKRGDFNDMGLGYNLAVYHDAKSCLAKYLEAVSAEAPGLKGLKKAAELYTDIAGGFDKMTSVVPFRGPEGTKADRDRLGELIEGAETCRDLEEEAMAIVKKVLED